MFQEIVRKSLDGQYEHLRNLIEGYFVVLLSAGSELEDEFFIIFPTETYPVLSKVIEARASMMLAGGNHCLIHLLPKNEFTGIFYGDYRPPHLPDWVAQAVSKHYGTMTEASLNSDISDEELNRFLTESEAILFRREND